MSSSFSEFDLKDLVDSKGGFFIPENDEKSNKESSKETPQAPNISVVDDPILFPFELNPSCEHCESIELKQDLKRNYKVFVCDSCFQSRREKYKQITKTQAKEDYLLTDEELGDETNMPYVSRANPHKSSWSDMKLFLRCQVEAFAIKKWGSLALIEEELDRRRKSKLQKRDKKFKKTLSDLRRKTRTEQWAQRHNLSEPSHEHEWEIVAGKISSKICRICKLTIEEEEI